MRSMGKSRMPRVPERAPEAPTAGNGARHSRYHLSLLPSGSDEVRDRLLRGDRPGWIREPLLGPLAWHEQAAEKQRLTP